MQPAALLPAALCAQLQMRSYKCTNLPFNTWSVQTHERKRTKVNQRTHFSATFDDSYNFAQRHLLA
eukprot:1160511-Pelagomonas_calceolata.AAC.6